MRLAAVLALSVLICGGTAWADEPWVMAESSGEKAEWPAEWYRDARPPELEIDEEAAGFQTGEKTDEEGASELFPHSEPRVDPGKSLARRLFEPPTLEDSSTGPGLDTGEGMDKAAGASKATFTSTRVLPGLQEFWPWRPTGKLFFRKGEAAFICSGSVIAPRLVLTAGHCVHSGFPNGFYTDFRFAPAYFEGEAPLGEWTWSRVWVAQSWAAGKGKIPNAADFAIIEFADDSGPGAPVRLGDVTGWYGLATLKLKNNHVTMLGYPANLDLGLIQHQCTSAFDRSDALKNEGYGCDMKGGSSGGPWLQNFAVPAVGQTSPAGPMVVGVTSWGRTQPANFWLNYSATPDGKIAQLRNAACAAQPGNC